MITFSYKRVRSGIIALATSLACSLTAPVPVPAQTTYTMKLATQTLDDGQHHFLKLYAAAVEKDSGGRIKATVYPAGQLGPLPQEVQEVQLGGIQCYVGVAENYKTLDPRFQTISAPGLFTNTDNLNKTLQDPTFKKTFYALGSDRGVQVVTTFLEGPLIVDTRKPIAVVTALHGLKIRSLNSPMQTRTLDAFGATAVPMSLGQVLPALQQGTIDGTESALADLSALHFYTAAPYVLDTEFSYMVSTVILSKSWLDSLPPDLRKIVMTDGQRLGDQMYPWIMAFAKNQRSFWQQSGGTIKELTSAERSQALATLAPVVSSVVSEPSMHQVYETIKQVATRAR